MAIVKSNLFTEGLSGSVGKQIVFRQRGGDTVVSKSPVFLEREPSEAQKAQQIRFQQAVIYGKAAISVPATKEAYDAEAKRGQSAFNVAFADFLSAPKIDVVDLTNYDGSIGSTITVRCLDDFKVESVFVKIENADGSIADQGDAVLDSNGLDWVFTATASNASLPGDKITVTATDSPGNETQKTQVI